jgi:hypothetical protein
VALRLPVRKKYDLDEVIVILSERDQRALARLVRKYGQDAVMQAVEKALPKRGRGRPSRGNLPFFEDAHLADWFNDCVEEHRQRGSRSPIKDAEHDLYEIMMPEEQRREPGRFVKWQKNIKKKRLQGRRNLAEIKRSAELRDARIAEQGRVKTNRRISGNKFRP